MNGSLSALGILWRLLVPFLITVLATWCFQAGVQASAIPGFESSGFWIHLYYSLSLFTFGGTAIGFPVGGPEWANLAVRILFFLAPAVSLAAIGEAVFRSVNPTLSFRIWKGGYRIVIGYGWVGRLLVQEIQRQFPGESILVVDRKYPTKTRSWRGILFIGEDALQPGLFSLLKPERSLGIFCVTADEMVNLNVFFSLQKHFTTLENRTHPLPKILVRVSSEDLLPELRKKYPGPQSAFFNVHIEAVCQLFDDLLPNPVLRDAQAWISNLRRLQPFHWIFLGFGRYGQTLLRQVIRDEEFFSALQSLTLIGPNVENDWRHFQLESEDHTPEIPTPLRLSYRQQEMQGIETIVNRCHASQPTVVVFASDDEVENLKVSALLSRALEKSNRNDVYFLIRTWQSSPVLVHLLASHRESRQLILPTQDYLQAYFEDYFHVGSN